VLVHPPPPTTTILAQALQGAKVARFAPFTAQEKHPQQCFGIPRPGNLLWDFNKHGDFIGFNGDIVGYNEVNMGKYRSISSGND